MKQTFIFNYEFLSYKKHKANDWRLEHTIYLFSLNMKWKKNDENAVKSLQNGVVNRAIFPSSGHPKAVAVVVPIPMVIPQNEELG